MNGSMLSFDGSSRRASRHSGVDEMKVYQEMMAKSTSGRVNEALHAKIENRLNPDALTESNNSVLERNRALLQYIATLADSNKKNDHFNYEFVESLIHGGADVNIADHHGQTIFHEVARSWNTDVAKFLLENGAEINKPDNSGRTPLHVAVSVDFAEMTEFLLQNYADIDARTFGEQQAPMHFAAKNGAVRSLKMLLGYNANIDSLDYRQRTPLQVAAEWTRDKTAKILIDEGSSSCLLDASGSSALAVLIDRLPHLALEALNQLQTTDIITMKKFFHINFLEASRMKLETKKTHTPLETAVATRKYEVVSHPVMQRLIHNKWVYFGRTATILDLCFYIVFNIMWTAMSMLTPPTGKELYEPLNENIWRVALLAVIGIMIIYQVGRQIRVTMKNISVKKHWIKWQTEKLQEDLKYCHPRWPQEEQAIRHEIKRISKLKGVNEADAWFYYDWIVLIVMITALVMHIVYYKVATDDLRYAYTRVLSVANLVVSLRLLKIMRPFPGIGTLVLILGETSGDFMNWAFLFFLLLVPFTASFWIIFGGLSLQPVNDYDEPDGLIFSVFRMAVGDDFNLEALIAAEPVMARILTVLYVTAMTIVTLNLLIALLSDTFTRVHSNAIANTIMQRAIKVLEAERTLSKQKKLNYREYIRINCSPEAVESVLEAGNYNGANNSKEITDNFKNLKTLLDDRFAAVYGKNKLSDFDKLKQDISKIKEIQRNQNDDLIRITEMLRKFKGNGTAKETSGDSTSSSTNEPSKKRIQIPALSLFRENIHWFSDNEGTREKKRKRNDQTKKRDDRRKDRKDRAQNDGQEMSLVPYQRVNSRDPEENGTYFSKDEYSQDNPTDRLDEWDKLSVDSITL